MAVRGIHYARPPPGWTDLVVPFGVGALMVGLARPNVGHLVMDHLNDVSDAQIRRVAQPNA